MVCRVIDDTDSDNPYHPHKQDSVSPEQAKRSPCPHLRNHHHGGNVAAEFCAGAVAGVHGVADAVLANTIAHPSLLHCAYSRCEDDFAKKELDLSRAYAPVEPFRSLVIEHRNSTNEEKEFLSLIYIWKTLVRFRSYGASTKCQLSAYRYSAPPGLRVYRLSLDSGRKQSSETTEIFVADKYSLPQGLKVYWPSKDHSRKQSSDRSEIFVALCEAQSFSPVRGGIPKGVIDLRYITD